MFPTQQKFNIFMASISSSKFPTEFIYWIWFQHYVLRSISATQQQKENKKNWKAHSFTDDMIPHDVASDDEKRIIFHKYLDIFWNECYGGKNTWCVHFINSELKVVIRKKTTWLNLQKHLSHFGRALHISFDDFKFLRENGINSTYTHGSSQPIYTVPYGIAGLINHNCGSGISMKCLTNHSTINSSVNVSFNYFVDADDDGCIDSDFDQNLSCPPFKKDTEFQIAYGNDLWFDCKCLHPSCIHFEFEEHMGFSKKRNISDASQNIQKETTNKRKRDFAKLTFNVSDNSSSSTSSPKSTTDHFLSPQLNITGMRPCDINRGITVQTRWTYLRTTRPEFEGKIGTIINFHNIMGPTSRGNATVFDFLWTDDEGNSVVSKSLKQNLFF